MILWLALCAHGAEVAAFLEHPPPGAEAALGPAAEHLERATGVPLTRWVWVDESTLSARDRRVHRVAPVPPPFERHDYDPPTPSFQADWLEPAPIGMGSRKLWSWPGGTGEYVVLADLEYDFDPAHEDLRIASPSAVVGEALGQFAYHGNGAIGIAAAARDGFGTTGAAPEVSVWVAHPMMAGSWQPARAIADVALLMTAGDVLLLEQQSIANDNFAPLSANPMAADAIEAATLLGITVIEPMGNGGQDADALEVGSPGSIRVGSSEPNSGTAHFSSNFGRVADVRGWGSAIPSPTTEAYLPDLFFPNQDPLQAYTSDFGGTSGASAQVAGVVVQLQSIAKVVHDEPLPVEVLRLGLAETGVAQADGLYTAEERWVGPAPDAQAFARTFLVP